MKNQLTLLAFLALAVTSCQPEQENDDLSTLREERDSLANVARTVNSRLLELDAEIAKLDSTTQYSNVSLYPLETGPFAHFFQVYGQIEADRNVTLYAESAGKVERIHVREGQTVRAGQPLLSLDDDVIRNNISEVTTSLELARTLFEKQERLWKQDIGSEVQYLEAKNRVESLESALATLNTQLAMSNLKAPFSGVVDQVFPRVGEYAAPGMPMIRLLNLNQVYVSADVPESYVGRVSVGNPVDLHFRSLEDTVKAKIIQVGQFINPNNRTFRVKIGIENSDPRYKPNLMASVRICDYATDSTIQVPSRILQQNPQGENFVYLYREGSTGIGTVEKRFVTPGMSYNGKTEILSGLTGDEVLIDRGARSVQDQEHVKAVN